MLKLMVVVMITFAHGKKGQEERIARSAFFGIRLPSDGVTSAVNQKCAVLQDNDAGNAGDQERAECSLPPIPKKAECHRDAKADQNRD